MKIKKYVLGDYMSNCYVITSNGEAIVIDPGYQNNVVIPYLKDANVKLKYIFLTHGHFDHIGGVNQLKQSFPDAKILIHKDDLVWLTDSTLALIPNIKVDETIDHEYPLTVGNITFDMIFTPGHSAGGIALYTKGHVFSGDTLFRLSIGRYDFPYSNFNDLFESVQKLYKLPDDTIVYPGHGENTEIGFEKKNNLFIKA